MKTIARALLSALALLASHGLTQADPPTELAPLTLPAAARSCDLVHAPPPPEGALPSRLIIGYRADAAPFSYLPDAEDDAGPVGEPRGYSVDLCRAVAGALVGPDNLSFVEVTATGRFADLAEGRVDLLCDSSTLTLRRAACFDHTLMTFPSGPALATLPQAAMSAPVTRVGVLAAPSSTRAIAETEATRQAIAQALNVSVESLELVEKPSYGALFGGLAPPAIEPDSPSPATPPVRLDAIFADREILLAYARDQGPLTVSAGFVGYEPYTIYLRPNRLLRHQLDSLLTELFKSPRIHALLNANFPLVSETVGQLITLQRIPAH